jgi:hypothetical protein
MKSYPAGLSNRHQPRDASCVPTVERAVGGLMVERGPLSGGELNAAVTSALLGIYTEYLSRGQASGR